MTVASRRLGLVLLPCLAPHLLAGCGHLLPRAETVVPEDLPAGSYRIDPEHASLLFKLDHLGFSQLVGCAGLNGSTPGDFRRRASRAGGSSSPGSAPAGSRAS
jgi:polyisoprenoid-binding protein YceI